MIDSATWKSRVEENVDVLSQLLEEDHLRGVPVLFFVNKQDLPNAQPGNEVTLILLVL